MAKRKIAECVSVRINVGNYQHIELTKYAEEEIEFSSQAERLEKEDALRDDLIASLTRSMKAIPEKLGKGIENAIEVEQSIKKAIPEWLGNGPVPNIANGALKISIQASAAQKASKDEAKEVASIEVPEVVKKKEVKKEVAEQKESPKSKVKEDLNKNSQNDESELFEADESESINPSTKIVSTDAKPDVKKPDVKPDVDADGLNMFNDEDDIFGEDSK